MMLSRLQCWGSALREMGVLITVFGPMYEKYEAHAIGSTLHYNCMAWGACGILFVSMGIEIERRQ